MAIIYGLLAFAALICIAVIAVSLLVLRRPDDAGAEEVLRLLAQHPDAEIAEQFQEYLRLDLDQV